MGKGDSTTVQKADPWGPAEPYLQNLLGQARDISRDGGFAPDPYGGTRVAPQSAGSSGAYDAVMRRGGGSPMIDNAYGGIDQLMRGQTPYAGMMQSDPRLAGMARSDPRLASMMSGKDIYRDLGAVKREALGSAVPAAMSMFSGNGMTDSSAAMDTVGRAATEAVAPIDYGAWQMAQDRRLAAVGQDNSTRLGAIGQDAGTRLSAYGLGQQGQLGAAGMAPGMQAASYLPAQMMAQFGAGRDAHNQAGIEAAMAKYYEGQNKTRDNFTGYADIISRIAGQGGTTSATGPSGQPSGAAKVAGAGLGGLGAYGALMMNPATAPFALLGGGLAGLTGLL
jgi:hypothetical protein